MTTKKYYKIGSIHYNRKTENYDIQRGPTDQGYVYKNLKNYLRYKDRPCYIPELHDEPYTRQDFLDICNNQKEIADILFDMVDWQSPETLFDELCEHNEIIQCDHCKKLILYGNGLENKTKCPYCNSQIENI